MPLRAQIDNEDIISIDLTDEQWNNLKKRLKTKASVLILPCCGQEGFLRKSSRGLKHFVHSKSEHTCDWKPESPEHLKAKIAIIEACKENGWEAIPEFSEADWRADVLAIQNNKRIAFEVQWSKQTFEETKYRQDRYKKSNVRGCWFFRTVPYELQEELVADKEIPAFRVSKDDYSNIIAQLDQVQLPLKSLVDNLLKRKLKFCTHTRLNSRQNVTIIFFEYHCWKCGKTQHSYCVERNFSTVCNRSFNVTESMWDSENIDKSPQIQEAVRQFLKTETGKNLKIGTLKDRFSRTVGHSYLSHGCFYCDAIFGDWYLQIDNLYSQNDSTNIRHVVEIDLGEMKEENPHWCYSENGQFCE